MKVAIITDQHFGARKGSKHLHDYFKQFYDDVFFPYIEEHGIDTIVDMGDTFDNRRSIDLWSLEWAKENYYDRLEKLGITVHTIVGNHTAYYKDTNAINSVDLLLKQYKNVKIYSECTEVMLDDYKFCLSLGLMQKILRAVSNRLKIQLARARWGTLITQRI